VKALLKGECFSDNIFSTMLSIFSLLSFVPQLDTINIKSVSVDNKVSLEDLKRESVIKQILLSVGAQGYFYKKLKMLVVRDNAKVIK
jgi:hypothetical protein